MFRKLHYHSIWEILYFALRLPVRRVLKHFYVPTMARPSRFARRWTRTVFQTRPKGFWATADLREIAARYPDWADRLWEFGTACSQDHVQLNESIIVPFRLPFQWQKDWETEVLSPPTYSPCMNPMEQKGLDYRRLWEAARLQWCVQLLLAADVHKERRWAILAHHAMVDFLNDNPVRRGIHWTSAMEVALRLFSWMQADTLLLATWPDLRDESFGVGIPLHAAELSRTLTTNLPTPNNHLIIETAALASVGLLYSKLPRAQQWMNTGSRILVEQLQKQTHDDGINKEMSLGYQRFTTEAVLLWHFVASRHGISSHVENWLDKNLQALTALRPPNGLWPMISDSDGGRVFRWDPGAGYWNFDGLLYASALALNRQPKPEWEPSSEGLLLAGTPTNAAVQKDVTWTHGSSGMRVHREGCAYLIVRGGRLGLGGEHFAGHAHSDLGSLHLWIDGIPFIADTGTFAYHEPDKDGWLSFRRSQAHAIVQVGDLEQFIPETLFQNSSQWYSEWIPSTDQKECIRVSSPDRQIVWQRNYTLTPDELHVVDTVVQSPIDEARGFLPFGLGWEPQRVDKNTWVFSHPDTKRQIQFISEMPGEIDQCPIHPFFGMEQSRFRLTVPFQTFISWKLTWI